MNKRFDNFLDIIFNNNMSDIFFFIERLKFLFLLFNILLKSFNSNKILKYIPSSIFDIIYLIKQEFTLIMLVTILSILLFKT